MSIPLLEIQPRELKFVVELKKQSSCSVRLTNNTHHYVAFKVKTTSPKKYCVRPNVGIVKPNSICEFTVIMQAFKELPLDMVCKDKFLIQSAIVLEGTTDEDITGSMFAKDEGRHVEENKLRVALVSPPHSPILSPINGTLKQGLLYDDSVLKDRVTSRPEIITSHVDDKIVKTSQIVSHEDLNPIKDADNEKEVKPAKRAQWQTRNSVVFTDDLSPVNDVKLAKDTVVDEVKLTKDAKVLPSMLREDVDDVKELQPEKNAEVHISKPVVFAEDIKPVNDVKPVNDEVGADEFINKRDAVFSPSKNVEIENVRGVEELKLVKDIEEMKSKLNELESKLKESDSTISKLIEERKFNFQERENLQQELGTMRGKTIVKQVHVGFPLLFVCMVAFISIILGYRLHS